MSLIIPAEITAGPEAKRRPAVAVLVDGFDPRGHDGLVPGLRALSSAAVQPRAVVTAIRPLTALPSRLITDQLVAALRVGPDQQPDAIGLGDPGDAERAAALVEALPEPEMAPPILITPCAVDRNGEPRFDPRALHTLVERGGPRAEVLIVDTAEAALLTGRRVPDRRRAEDACRRLSDFGVGAVICTGGRLEGHAIDLVYDGRDFTEFGADRVELDHPRGAGRTFGALVLAHRARGRDLLEAVAAARRGVDRAFAHPMAVGPSQRVDPLGGMFALLNIDPRPIVVPETDQAGPAPRSR